MSAALSQLEREAARVLEGLRRLELIDVSSAAKLLKTSPKWVRANLPIIVLGPRQSRIRAADIEAYQLRRTVWPGKEFPRRAA
jgi:hypothetical protein